MDPVNEPTQVATRDRLRIAQALLADLRTADFPLELVPDRESTSLGNDSADFTAIGGGLRVLVKLHWNQIGLSEIERDPSLLSTGQRMLAAVPDADAALLVVPRPPYPCVVIDAYRPAQAVRVPSGEIRDLPYGQLAESARGALRELFYPAEADWSGLPDRPLAAEVRHLADISTLMEIANSGLDDILAAGRRARLDAKKVAWMSLSEQDARWVADRVHRVLTGRWDPQNLPNDIDLRIGDDSE
jgi:hypothetical protein